MFPNVQEIQLFKNEQEREFINSYNKHLRQTRRSVIEMLGEVVSFPSQRSSFVVM